MKDTNESMVKTVKLDDEVHTRLANYGTKVGETFQDVIVRLMDFWDAEHK